MTFRDTTLYTSIQNNNTDTVLDELSKIDSNSIELLSIPKDAFLSNWSVFTIIFMLIVMVSVNFASEKYLISLIQSLFNKSTALRLFRERINNILHPSFRLDILFYVVTGTIFLHAENAYLQVFAFRPPLTLLLNISSLIIFVNGKYILYRVSAFIFKGQNEVNEFIFYTKSGNRIMGLFLFPIAVFMYFSSGLFHVLLLILAGLTVLFVASANLLRGITIIVKKDFSKYYLILYLCILEILPLLIVWRILWRI